MPHTPEWMAQILERHPTRNYRIPNVRVISRRIPDSILLAEEGAHLQELFRHLPEAHSKLEALRQAIEKARPKGPPYAREGNFAEHARARRAWADHLRALLVQHPQVRQRFISYLESRRSEATAQVTWAGRHRETDETLRTLFYRLNFQPSSFLEVGAAFHSRSDIEPRLPDDLAPVYEAKQFFDEQGFPMKYTAADIVPISKDEQQRHIKRGVFPITWDYRRRPLYRAQGKVKQFSVIRMANVSRHQTREEFRRTLRVLLQSLEPNGILVIKNQGEGLKHAFYKDEVYYQKVKHRTWKLSRVQPT
ncbi:MAG: hypothetical protein ABH863_00730 [Candidatus Micrarchaeota archaeon]